LPISQSCRFRPAHLPSSDKDWVLTLSRGRRLQWLARNRFLILGPLFRPNHGKIPAMAGKATRDVLFPDTGFDADVSKSGEQERRYGINGGGVGLNPRYRSSRTPGFQDRNTKKIALSSEIPK